MRLKFIDGDEIRQRFDVLGLIETLRAGHRRSVPEMERVLMTEPGSRNNFLVWHAWGSPRDCGSEAGHALSFEPISQSSEAERAGRDHRLRRPRRDTDGGDRRDGAHLLEDRSLLGTGRRLPGPARPRTLLMVGAGGLAPYLVMAHRAVRPSIDRVLIWNRTRAKAEELATNRMVGGDAEVVEDLDTAVSEADVITAATGSLEPVIRGELVRPSTHVDLVGGFTPEMREADDTMVRRATLFVDASMFTIDHCGDICRPLAAGVIERRDIEADLFGLCRSEHPGRRSLDQITLYKSGGGAHLDLMATVHTLEAVGMRRRVLSTVTCARRIAAMRQQLDEQADFDVAFSRVPEESRPPDLIVGCVDRSAGEIDTRRLRDRRRSAALDRSVMPVRRRDVTGPDIGILCDDRQDPSMTRDEGPRLLLGVVRQSVILETSTSEIS